ncbi:hypothetical protein BH11PSE9_BH11PSE9_36420 [soil metagenome]
MIARLQRFVTVALLLVAASWAVSFWRVHHPVWAPAGAALVILGYVSFLGLEFCLMAMVHRGDAAPRATVIQLLSAWWGEVTTAPRVFCWRQPFRSWREPDSLRGEVEGRRGVVLVHGFFCNRGMWNPWMTELRKRQIPFAAVNLEPVFGSLDRYLGALESAVQQVESATGLAPVIVGHSMGGLVIRAWYANQADPLRVHHLVTIGTPHQGTWLARFGHAESARQMRIGSAWLQALRERETHCSHHYTCFYSHCDNIVFPASTATLAGADNRHLTATAHVQMAFHPAVFDEVCHWLSTSDRPPPRRPPQSPPAPPPADRGA